MLNSVYTLTTRRLWNRCRRLTLWSQFCFDKTFIYGQDATKIITNTNLHDFFYNLYWLTWFCNKNKKPWTDHVALNVWTILHVESLLLTSVICVKHKQFYKLLFIAVHVQNQTIISRIFMTIWITCRQAGV